MKGFITYQNTSSLSPEYPNPITINGKLYTSPSLAIKEASSPSEELEIMIHHVKAHPDIYKPYKDLQFKGEYSSLLNKAIDILFTPKLEPVNMDKYMKILPKNIHEKIKAFTSEDISIGYSIPIIRYIYTYQSLGNDIYKPLTVLNTVESYKVYAIDINSKPIPLYSGLQGSFILLDSIREITDVLSPLIQKIEAIL